MSDETKGPDELWSVRDTVTKRTPTNTHIVSGLSWTEVLPSEEAARKRGEILGLGTTREFEPVLIGVSPAIRDERDALRAEVDRLKAELATLRGEGPIRVGDVVQFPWCGETVSGKVSRIAYVVYRDGMRLDFDELSGLVRMPDGTPVDQ